MRQRIPLPMKEDPIPLKICSFDIEASSSHGDFPLAKKNYEKLAIDILDCWDKYTGETLLQDIILSAFSYGDMDEVHEIFPKQQPTFKELAQTVYDMISDADLAGFNSNRFDIPLLAEEFLRAGLTTISRSSESCFIEE